VNDAFATDVIQHDAHEIIARKQFLRSESKDFKRRSERSVCRRNTVSWSSGLFNASASSAVCNAGNRNLSAPEIPQSVATSRPRSEFSPIHSPNGNCFTAREIQKRRNPRYC
jgi:hypothetical protein